MRHLSFDEVDSNSARSQSELAVRYSGLKVVAVSDSRGGVYNPNGLDLAALERIIVGDPSSAI